MPGSTTPAIAALVAGGVLFEAARTKRSIIDTLLQRPATTTTPAAIRVATRKTAAGVKDVGKSVSATVQEVGALSIGKQQKDGIPSWPKARREGWTTARHADALIRKYAPSLSRGSGYRSPAENARVGGSPTSDHMKGTPADPGAWDVPVDAYGSLAKQGDRLAAAARAKRIPQVLWKVEDHYDHVHLGYGDPS